MRDMGFKIEGPRAECSSHRRTPLGVPPFGDFDGHDIRSNMLHGA